MIPEFNHAHVLPPFLGDSAVQSALTSPYGVTATGLVERFAHSRERAILLLGLLDYRRDLASFGFCKGFQWLDGSFAEDIEGRESRAPGDIDMVTFAYSPEGKSKEEIESVLNQNPTLFDVEAAKLKYGCDGYLVRLDGKPEALLRRGAYYFNLFSHRRGDHVWKGLLHLPLADGQLTDEDRARAMLENVLGGQNHAATT